MKFRVRFTGSRLEFGYYDESKTRKATKKDIVIAAVCAIALILVFAFIFIPAGEVTGALNTAVSAFVKDEQQMWKENVHPDYMEELGDLEALKESIGRRATSLGSSTVIDNSDSSAIPLGEGRYAMDVPVVDRGRKYLVKIEYLDDDSGKGITAIEVEYIGSRAPATTTEFQPPIRNNG